MAGKLMDFKPARENSFSFPGCCARANLVSLVAAGLGPKGINNLGLQGALVSLKENIEKNWSGEQKPEMFCFGLLQAFDIKQLEALVAPRAIVKK